MLNECYRSLTSPAAATSKPVCILDFRVPAGAFDVNVTPDKRKASAPRPQCFSTSIGWCRPCCSIALIQVMLQGERQVLEALEQALRALWEPSRFTYRQAAPVLGASSGRGLRVPSGVCAVC